MESFVDTSQEEPALALYVDDHYVAELVITAAANPKQKLCPSQIEEIQL